MRTIKKKSAFKVSSPILKSLLIKKRPQMTCNFLHLPSVSRNSGAKTESKLKSLLFFVDEFKKPEKMDTKLSGSAGIIKEEK